MLKSTIIIFPLFVFAFATSYQCSSDCLTCSSDYICTACSPGYSLVANKCVPCAQHCSACNDNGECTVCNESILQNGQCLKCSGNCRDSTSCWGLATNCTSCSSPLVLGESKQCKLDMDCPVWNCISCSAITSTSVNKTCQACKPNYFAYNQTCHVCPFPCSACNLPIQQMFSEQVSQFMNLQLNIAYNTSGSHNYSGLSYWQKQNLFELFVLYNMVGTNSSTKQQFNNKLKQYGILVTTDSINALKLNSIQVAGILKILYSRVSQQTAFTIMLNKIRSAYVTCTACHTQFYSDSGQCSLCSKGCLSCVSKSNCAQCSSGYVLVGQMCQKCIPPCLTCQDSPSSCTSCIRPYFLGSHNCQLCQATNCETCSADQTQCLTCARPFSHLPFNGACYRCRQDICYHCSQTNKSICLQCIEGATLNLNGTCILCPLKCSRCTFSSGSLVCNKCMPGLTLLNGVCTSCGKGCLVCSTLNTSICELCSVGMFINSASLCQSCGNGCRKCTNYDGICTELAPGYVVEYNKTRRCETDRCRVCSFQNPTQCLQCSEGNYLSYSLCVQCTTFCLQCTATACTLCRPNTVLIAGACYACAGNCLTCQPSNLSTCTSCKQGFVLNSTTNLCSLACESGCAQCSALNRTCLKCKAGFSLKSDGICVRCMLGCTGTCNSNNITQCLSCNFGFEKREERCSKCGSSCQTCIQSACTSCVQGYSLVQAAQKNVCKKNCNFPCKQCDSVSCLTCENGFISNGTDCVFDYASACIPECSNCPAGSFFDNVTNRCRRCAPRGCSRCPEDNCEACFDGFYYIIFSCMPCPTNCRTCLSNSKCTSCADGYIRDIISADTDPTLATLSPSCVPCSRNCKTCIISSTQCQTCYEGYRLRDSQCFGRNSVGFEFRFQTDYNSFLYNGYTYNLISSIALAVGSENKDIIIESLRIGSTIVNGSISAESQVRAQQIANLLYAAVNANPLIFGYLITQINVAAYYDDIQNYDASIYRGVPALIIGCGVALAVLFCFAFLLVCYLRKINQKSNRLQKKPYSTPIKLDYSYESKKSIYQYTRSKSQR